MYHVAPIEDEELFCMPNHLKPNPFQEVQIADAPFGTRVFQTKSSDIWLETRRYPIDTNSTYLCFGNLRWLGDGDPKKYYITVYEYDFKKVTLTTKGGAYHYYYHSGFTLPNNEWVTVKFPIGKNGYPHHPEAKFFSIGAGVNYSGGSGTIQYNGFNVVRVVC